MSLDVVIGVIGVLVTASVVVGMILITPRGTVPARASAGKAGAKDAAQTASATQPAGP
jgi:hypothetical protein